MKAVLSIDGCDHELTTTEAKAAAKAIMGVRGKHVREVRDKMAYRLYSMGCSYASIGKVLGITTRAVKGALTRVENGRYGSAW